jgi:hypothetical protein
MSGLEVKVSQFAMREALHSPQRSIIPAIEALSVKMNDQS